MSTDDWNNLGYPVGECMPGSSAEKTARKARQISLDSRVARDVQNQWRKQGTVIHIYIMLIWFTYFNVIAITISLCYVAIPVVRNEISFRIHCKPVLRRHGYYPMLNADIGLYILFD
jgi:hypothetical protein